MVLVSTMSRTVTGKRTLDIKNTRDDHCKHVPNSVFNCVKKINAVNQY